jgi:serine/threonine protein kinase
VRKHRLAHAPLLVWLGGALVRVLDTGVRVLPQRAWVERERHLHQRLRGTSVRIEPGGALVLPCLSGATLASVLDDPASAEPVRRRAIALAVAALAALHRLGFTHGDAMAENVMIDLEAGAAHWFDFETVHDATRSPTWRRADDLRALLATALLRTRPERLAATLQLVLDAYADEQVIEPLAASFASTLRRPLAFHLGQAPLSPARYREIARLLRARVER